MGIAFSEDFQTMAIAARDEIVLLRNSTQLAMHYPSKPNVYDAMYLPRASFYTNALDIHDLDFLGEQLVAVNTLFSCIMRVGHQFSFEPLWSPPFITELSGDDKCHLNGIAVENGNIRYATAFGRGDSARSWKATIPDSGIMIDLNSGDILSAGLAMPHSPRLVNGRLLALLSATGQLVEIDRSSGAVQVLKSLTGFVRGMAFYHGYLFIAHSRLRRESSSFGKLGLPYNERRAGITILHLESLAVVGEITYQQSVDEIYDVKILPGYIRPNILNNISDDFKYGLSTPEKTYWARKPETS